jgi:predicted DNA-binding transcriptional regulator AlpA
MKRQNASPIKTRRALKINDFCEAYGPSRSTAYSWIRSGLLPDIKIGGTRIIPVDAAEALLKSEEIADV